MHNENTQFKWMCAYYDCVMRKDTQYGIACKNANKIWNIREELFALGIGSMDHV